MTAPLTPAECDLQDFAFMPLHVARLRDSNLAAEAHPEACWYAVLLWSASWHQLPAGSLPNNDAVLARLCNLGRDMRTFKRHRTDALRGWIECSDGRLYHPVVAEQVNAAWTEKLAYRERKATRKAIAEKAATSRWSKAPSIPDADASGMHDASQTDASCIAHAMLKGRGTGTGSYSVPSGTGSPPPDPDPPASIADPDRAFWANAKSYLRPHTKGDPGALIGKWCRDFGKPAAAGAIGAAQVERAVEPVSYIEAVLRKQVKAGVEDDPW